MLVLQGPMELVKVEPGSYSEICLTSSLVGNELTGIKVEKVADMTEEEGVEPMTSAVIKAEPEVRYTSVCFVVYIP
jgi:hypothetical protein